MEQVLSTFVRSIFVDNMIFAYYLGMCSFVAVSKNVKTALGLGSAKRLTAYLQWVSGSPFSH